MPTQRDQPCPPTPPAVAEAATDAIASHRAAQAAAAERDRVRGDEESYRDLAISYFDRLSEVGRDDTRFRQVMQEFGRYLYREGVQPEHIVICAREATQHVRFREHDLARRLAEHVIGWIIEGYYMERDVG
jgi:hypothetical protein